MTRKQLLAAVCVLGACAIAVDRFVLGAGDGVDIVAPADIAMPVVPAVTATVPSPVVPPTLASTPSPTVARRLTQVKTDIRSLRDAFISPQSVATSAADSVDESATEKFVAAHQLQGVLRSTKGHAAIVDGRIVRVGQAIDGFSLKRVDRRSATFMQGDLRVVLALQSDELPADAVTILPQDQ